ncbi:MAG: hypothetical protein H0U56_12040 [Methylibium sp.]|nr:hypothetical protein [Methylibium sp.]
MYRPLAVAAMALIAAAAMAQTVQDLKNAPESAPRMIPEIPAGTDPMDRKPDPAADEPAAKTLQQPAATADDGGKCQVRRAETDTGFVVVCDEDD